MTGPQVAHPDVPLYEEVAAKLKQLIEEQQDKDRGRLSPGKLPSERTLSEELGVSRVTVRRALQHLAGGGQLIARRGRGWFVNDGGVAIEPPGTLVSLTDVGQRRGFRVSAVVLRQEVRPASLDEADMLGVVAGSDVLDLWRLRKFDNLVIALQKVVVPLDVASGLENVDFRTASLYETLEHQHGVVIERGVCSIEARPADEHQAEALGVPVGSATLWFRQIGYDRAGRAIELTDITYRGDRYRFQSVLVRSEPS